MNAADRCPGVLRPHPAEDGLMIRLRVPGGRSSGRTLAGLAEVAAAYGHDELQLTSRGGLQVRGLSDPVPAPVRLAVDALGLLPSPAHDRVRNVLCSPLTGISGGAADLRAMPAELDRAILAEPALAELPGRFLFVLDDGRGDVAGLPFDLGYRASSAEDGEVLVGGPGRAVPVRRSAAVGVLVELARGFLRARAGAGGRGWHVRELPSWAAGVGATVAAPPVTPPEIPLGRIGDAASVRVPLGQLTPEQVRTVSALAPDLVVLTPWRGLVLPQGAEHLDELVAAGLVADPDSGWARVSACVGAPYCARTTVDTRAVASTLVRDGVSERTHVSGCPRRCGAPTTPYVDLVGAA